jgi:hypothetical protein
VKDKRPRPEETTIDQASIDARSRMLGGKSGFTLPATDGVMAFLLLLVAIIPFLPPALVPAFLAVRIDELRENLIFGLTVEGAFLMMQWSLTDIAVRLTKRPPLPVVILIAAGLIVMYPETRVMLLEARERGLAVLLPLLVSLAQRFTILWRMPSWPRIARIASDALVQNRVLTGLGLFGVLLVLLMVSRAVPQLAFLDVSENRDLLLAAGAVYFAIAAYDDRRVRTNAFARRPRILFKRGKMDLSDYPEPEVA